jgi:hypothetical protein
MKEERVKSDRASSKLKKQDIELVSDAWPRFEKFIKEIAKAGPQHRTAAAAVKKPKERPASKGRVHKGKTHV